MRRGAVDLAAGAVWMDGGARTVLDVGRSVIVEHRVPARYLGPVMPGSDSNPSGPRARQRWLLLGWTPALYNDTVPVLLTPGQIVEVT